MGRKLAVYGAGLIALYLLVENATGAGTLLDKSASGSVGIIRALQGRAK
jgi:hypothetical protein